MALEASTDNKIQRYSIIFLWLFQEFPAPNLNPDKPASGS
jgi:hypothetical protein